MKNILSVVIVAIVIVFLVVAGVYYFYAHNPQLQESEEMIVIEELNAEMRTGEVFDFDIVPEHESFDLEEKMFKGIITYTEFKDDGSSVGRFIEGVVISVKTSPETQITTFVAGTERVHDDNLTLAELKDMSGGIGPSAVTVIGEVIDIENSEIIVIAEKIKRYVQ